MTTTSVVLFEAKFAETTQTDEYTSANVQTSIDKITATNVTGLAATITVNLLAPGDTAGASDTLTFAKTVQPGKPYIFPEIVGHILAVGGKISIISGTANAIVIRASGRQFS